MNQKKIIRYSNPQFEEESYVANDKQRVGKYK